MSSKGYAVWLLRQKDEGTEIDRPREILTQMRWRARGDADALEDHLSYLWGTEEEWELRKQLIFRKNLLDQLIRHL